jgi:ribosome-binding protein aMBF1 (putative translation factor)
MKDSQRIARLLSRPIGHLDAMVVPLSEGGRDGHGHHIGSEADLLERLSEGIGEARAALDLAQNELARLFSQS